MLPKLWLHKVLMLYQQHFGAGNKQIFTENLVKLCTGNVCLFKTPLQMAILATCWVSFVTSTSSVTMIWIYWYDSCWFLFEVQLTQQMCFLSSAVRCRWAGCTGRGGECSAVWLCQAGGAGPGTAEKALLCCSWRPGSSQCLYWWARCPGGYEGNKASCYPLHPLLCRCRSDSAAQGFLLINDVKRYIWP